MPEESTAEPDALTSLGHRNVHQLECGRIDALQCIHTDHRVTVLGDARQRIRQVRFDAGA